MTTIPATAPSTATAPPIPQSRPASGPRRAVVDDQAAVLARTLAVLPADDPRRIPLRDKAIEAWLPLAAHLAKRFNGRGEPLDDLVQIARIGLIKAIDRFDLAHGEEFAAYAVPTIVGEIKRHFRDRTWDVRVPRRLQELKLDISQAVGHLAQRLGRSPTVADVAAYLRRSEDEVIEGIEGTWAYRAVSLQAPTGDGADGIELGDLIGAEDGDLALAEFRVAIGPALRTLCPREQRIVMLRFYGNLTQTQIAQHIGISQMHVSRLLAKALATLRAQLLAG